MTDLSDLEEKSPPIPDGRRMDLPRRSKSCLDSISSTFAPAPIRDRAMVDGNDPGMDGRISPVARNVMISETDPAMGAQDLCFLALGHLADGGSEQERMFARASRSSMKG